MSEVVLENEYRFYKDNESDLLTKYPSKYLVIKDQAVQGAFDTLQQAYSFGAEKFALGTFLIQLCNKDQSDTIQTFHSRVVFA